MHNCYICGLLAKTELKEAERHRHQQHIHPLLVQLASGDETALRQLIKRYHNLVFHHALTFIKTVEEAEEATQDIFLKLWQNRDKLPALDNFVEYLFIISRNYLIDRLRKKVLATQEMPDPETLEEELMPDHPLQFRQMQELIQKGLQSLTDQQRTAIELSKIQELTYEEAGRIMGISKNTVKWHVVAGLNALKVYFSTNAEMVLFLLVLFKEIMKA
jgi:RNA polymerase sigma-70 factor (ECF subfamily)